MERFARTKSGRIVEALSLMELVNGSWVPARNLPLGEVMDAKVLSDEEVSKLPSFEVSTEFHS